MTRGKCSIVSAIGLSLSAVLAINTALFADTAVVHVDGDNGNPDASQVDGSSWAEAYKHLQDGLDQADILLGPSHDYDTVEIWVAAMQPGNGVECGEGAYRPDLGANYTEGDHTARFELRNNVELYGGFPPGGSVWDARNTYANETILAGEIWHCDSGQCPQHEDPTTPPNCTIADVVVAAEDVDETARLEGFTIRSSMEYGSPGLGMRIDGDAVPKIVDCRFDSNANGIEISGGGYAGSNDAIEFRGCEFVANHTVGDGGAIEASLANMNIIDCTFRGNQADSTGGAICARDCNTSITHSFFRGNVGGQGGALYVADENDGAMRILNSVVKLNESTAGGALYVNRLGIVEIANSTLVYNSATDGDAAGGIHFDGNCISALDDWDIANSIIYFNESDGEADLGAQLRIGDTDCDIAVTFSNIQTGSGGSLPGYCVNCHDSDPMFMQDRAHRVALQCESPNVDAGFNCDAPFDEFNVRNDPAWQCDLDGTCDPACEVAPDYLFQPRIVDGKCEEVVDIGAIEFHAEIENCQGDLNRDGTVDGADLGTLLSAWGPCSDCGNCASDLTGDCSVGGADLGTLLSNWGACEAGCECDDPGGGGGESSTMSGGGDNMFYEWLIYASYDEVVDWLDMMGYWPE